MGTRALESPGLPSVVFAFKRLAMCCGHLDVAAPGDCTWDAPVICRISKYAAYRNAALLQRNFETTSCFTLRAYDSLGDAQFALIVGERQTSLKRENDSPNLPFGVFDQGVALPFMRAAMFNPATFVRTVLNEPSAAPHRDAASSNCCVIRIGWRREPESILRQRFV